MARDGGRGGFGASARAAAEALLDFGCGRRVAAGLRDDLAALRFIALKFPRFGESQGENSARPAVAQDRRRRAKTAGIIRSQTDAAECRSQRRASAEARGRDDAPG